jgi:hypothetical protein
MTRSRARTLGLAAVPALVPVVVFWKALLGRTLLAPGDGFVYYLPVHVLTADAWRAGHVPGWNEYAFSGSPLLASAQAGPFYPPNLLFLVLPWLWANNLVLVLDLALAGVGTFLLARRLTGDAVAAAVAGAGFVSSGFVYGHLAHQSIEAVVAWLPWTLWAYERLRERPTVPRLLVLAATLALAVFGGHYQLFFFALAVLVVYAAVSGGVAAGLPRTLRRLRPPVSAAWLGGAIAGGLALGAVQLLPTASILGHTLRGSGTLAAATTYSFSLPSHLELLLFPYLFGTAFPGGPFDAPYHGLWNQTELAGYPGLACLVLAAAGWRRSLRDPRALALIVVAGLALLVATGDATPFARVVLHTPPFGRFRAWARYVVALDLAVAVLAAYGLAALRETRGRRGAWLGAWGALAMLAAAALFVRVLHPAAGYATAGRSGTWAVAIPLAAAAGAAVLALVVPRLPRVASVLVCVLVVADGFASFGGFFEWRHAPSSSVARAAYSPSDPPPWGPTPDRPGGIDRYLFVGNDPHVLGLYSPQVTALKELRSANGLEPLAPTPYTTLVGGMQDAGNLARPRQFLDARSPLLDVLRVSLVLVPADAAPTVAPTWASGTRQVAGLVGYEYRPRVPDAFLAGGRGRVTAERRGAGAIDVRVDARRSGLLVLSEDWFPGWRATVDGRGAAVVRTQGVVLGVRVPTGSHRVSLRYRVPGFRAGAAISLAALVLLVSGALLHRRRLKRAAGIEPA